MFRSNKIDRLNKRNVELARQVKKLNEENLALYEENKELRSENSELLDLIGTLQRIYNLIKDYKTNNTNPYTLIRDIINELSTALDGNR